MTNHCWMQVVVALGLFLSNTMATQDNEYYQYWYPAHGQQLIQEATGYRRQSASPRQALAALGALASSPVANLAVAAAGVSYGVNSPICVREYMTSNYFSQTVGSVAFTATQASALSSRADDLAKRMDTSDSTVSGLSTSASTQGARISSLETTTTSLSSTSSTSSTSIKNVCTVV